MLGKFVSPDTIVSDVGSLAVANSDDASITLFKQNGKPIAPQNPQNLNRYSYTGNKPLTGTDPTGHCDIDDLECHAEMVELGGEIGGLACGPECAPVGAAIGLGLDLASNIIGGLLGGGDASDASSGAGGDFGNDGNNGDSGGIETISGSPFSKQQLLDSATQLDPSDKGGKYTRAGRALEKHSNRIGSVFVKPNGILNPDNWNAGGKSVVEEILDDPSTSASLTNARYWCIVKKLCKATQAVPSVA